MLNFLIPTAYASAGIEFTVAGSGASIGSGTSFALFGALQGILESVETIELTVNNEFFFTIAIMFIGLAVVIGFLSSMVRGHRRV